LSTLVWTSSPTTTVSAGAPKSPSASTSQPCRASSACRAAARPVKFAIVAPVTNPASVPGGRPSSSRSQRVVTSSSRAAIGEETRSPAFWSQAPASQFAATVAGSAPPVTKPK